MSSSQSLLLLLVCIVPLFASNSWIKNPENGKKYLFHNDCVYSKQKANDICTYNLNGTGLAISNTASIRSFLTNNVYDGTTSSTGCASWSGFWTDGRLDFDTQTIKFSNGKTTLFSSVNWDNWAAGQEPTDGQYCFGFRGSSKKWHSVECDESDGFFCEWNINDFNNCSHPEHYHYAGWGGQATCNWYIDCLEATFECGSTGYPLGYGYYYCHRYDVNKDSFTLLGQEWIEEVKLCLQESLKPAMNQHALYSCDSLRTFAFKTHTGCYLGYNGGISVCDLTVYDWALILKTVFKGIFSTDGPTQTLQILLGCGKYYGIKVYHLVFKNDWNEFKAFLNHVRVSMDDFGGMIKDKLKDYFSGLDNGLVPIGMYSGSFYEGSVVFELNVLLNDTKMDYMVKQQIERTMDEINFYNFIFNSSQSNITRNDTNFTLTLFEVIANVTVPDDDKGDNDRFNIEIHWIYIVIAAAICLCLTCCGACSCYCCNKSNQNNGYSSNYYRL